MNDFTAGFFLGIASVALIVRSLLLNPKNKGWPPAPNYIRVSMFLLGCAVAYRGMELVGGTIWAAPIAPEPYGVPFSGALVSAALANYSVAMAFNVFRQYYPKAVWRSVERIMTLATCQKGALLVQLSRMGVYVMMPNRKDDPEPINEHDIIPDPDVYLSKD